MELREYLTIRRAYNLVRQQRPAEERLTFVELAILCRLKMKNGPLTTSQIAEYQSALRPTMTHRTKHLYELGLLNRTQGSTDRRNVICTITEKGDAFVDEACRLVCERLRGGTVLSRTSPRRVCRYVDAMGSLNVMSGELVLLAIMGTEDARATVGELVQALGLLQPTVSMSVAALEEEGLVSRETEGMRLRRSAPLRLTDEGAARAQELLEQIRQLVVRRG